MYKRLLRSVLAAAFSAVVAYGVLGGADTDWGIAPETSTTESGWGGAQADSGWGYTPGDSGWGIAQAAGTPPDSGWGSGPADSGWGSTPADTGA